VPPVNEDHPGGFAVTGGLSGYAARTAGARRWRGLLFGARERGDHHVAR